LFREVKQGRELLLRGRVSRGAERLLGWVPFKAAAEAQGQAAALCRQSICVFERDQLEGAKRNVRAHDGVGTGGCVPIEQRIARAQRRGHKRQVKRRHRTAHAGRVQIGSVRSRARGDSCACLRLIDKKY